MIRLDIEYRVIVLRSMGGVLSPSLSGGEVQKVLGAYICDVRNYFCCVPFCGEFFEIIQVVEESRVCHPRSRRETNC